MYLCWLAGAITFLAGVLRLRKPAPPAPAFEALLPCTPVLIGAPMAVFGMDHFVFFKFVSSIVPSWIPFPAFWAYFVGVCLIVGGLALALDVYGTLAVAAFAAMMFSLVLLMHIPAIAQEPHDRFGWAVGGRDFSFGAGALCYAVSRWSGASDRLKANTLLFARVAIGIACVFFAAEHFLHPEFKPGIPLEEPSPAWFPLRSAFGYLTGLALLLSGMAFIVNIRVRLAAVSLGWALLFLTVAMYVPITIAQPLAVEHGLNYVADTLLQAGTVLGLAHLSHAVAARTLARPAPQTLAV